MARALPPLPDDFINDETRILVCVDLAQATPSTIDATGRGVLENLPEFGEIYEALRTDFDACTNAGARFMVLAAADTRSQDVYAFMPVVGLFVDAEQCDEATLTELLRKHTRPITDHPVIERHGDWLLLWESQRLILTHPLEDGPDLDIPGFDPERCKRVRAAYQALDGRAIGLAWIPTDHMHEQALEEWNALPDQIHQSPVGIRLIAQRAQEIHGWIDLGHNPSITAVAELAEVAQATQLSELIRSMSDRFKAEVERLQEEPEAAREEMASEMALAGRIIGAINCVQQGSTVTVSIGQADLRPILDMAGPMLVQQRRQAQEMVLMSNARQISISLIMYANDHDNQWPDSLDVLAETRLMTRQQLDELLTHPVTGAKLAFEYVKPDKPIDKLEHAEDVVVLRELENGAVKKGGITCYADGHVESGS